jgi:SAM-dependent methyltransferase
MQMGEAPRGGGADRAFSRRSIRRVNRADEDGMAKSGLSLACRRTLFVGFIVGVAGATIAVGQAQQLDVVFVATPMETVNRMLLLAGVSSGDFVIDLGSGDGRIAIAAGRLGARALGVDLDPDRIREARANAKLAGVTNRVTFLQQDLFKTDLSKATVVTMYLLPEINLKLRPRILELRAGTRVVSHDFDMGDWKPELSEKDNWRIHYWVVPARIAGDWQLNNGKRWLNLKIEQKYQEFKGAVTVDGRSVPLRNTKLVGTDIQFDADTGWQTFFRGTVTVSGDKMEGVRGLGTTWSAKRVAPSSPARPPTPRR